MSGDGTTSVEVVARRRARRRPAKILVTNDDGIGSAGLHELARGLAENNDVVVVAPEGERSGSGTGIGHFDPGSGVAVTPTDVGGVDGYALAGPPGLAVMAAMLGAFGDEPDLVVSGVNPGINTGHSVLHSGTVGAVLTARTFGCDGLAVSLGSSEPWKWSTAVTLAKRVAAWVLSRSGTRFTLNLNVPALDLADVRGLRWADLDEFGFFRVAITDVPGQRVQFEVGDPDAGLDPASDTAMVREGYATLTALTSIEPAPFPAGGGPGHELE